MKELLPVNQHVALDITDEAGEQKTASGIIIPDTAKEKPNMAKVVWMGVIENAEIKPGDVVLFKKFGGTEIDFEGRKILLLPYSEILAKLVETEEI
jgi:chaperonin GroES